MSQRPGLILYRNVRITVQETVKRMGKNSCNVVVKWVSNPSVTGPVPCTIPGSYTTYCNALILVEFPFPPPVPIPCSVNMLLGP